MQGGVRSHAHAALKGQLKTAHGRQKERPVAGVVAARQGASKLDPLALSISIRLFP